MKRDDRIFVNYNQDKYNQLMLSMDIYYKNKMPIIIGWATAQAFCLQLKNDQLKIPILFLHGLTTGGKTTLSDVILAMYGVDMTGKNKDNFRVSLSSNSTTKGASRLRDELCSIPMHFDEYTDDFKEKAKTWYDRASDILAVKSTDNQVYQREINSGTIISSVNISKYPELINRCVYVSFDTNRHENAAAFDTDIMENLQYFGSFIVDTVMNYTVEDLDREYNKSLEYFDKLMPGGSPRVKKNYALVRAGAKLNKHLLSPENQHNLDRADYWINKMNWVQDKEKSFGLTDVIMGTIVRIINEGRENTEMYFKANKNKTSIINGREYTLVYIKISDASWALVREYNNRANRELNNISQQEANAILLRHDNRDKSIKNMSYKDQYGRRSTQNCVAIYHPSDDFDKFIQFDFEDSVED